MEPFIAALAVEVTRRHAGSALPDAPIRPARRDRRRDRRRVLRHRSAALLHRLADRLDAHPAPLPNCGA